MAGLRAPTQSAVVGHHSRFGNENSSSHKQSIIIIDLTTITIIIIISIIDRAYVSVAISGQDVPAWATLHSRVLGPFDPSRLRWAANVANDVRPPSQCDRRSCGWSRP